MLSIVKLVVQALLTSFLLAMSCSFAAAGINRFGPFSVDSMRPDAIELNGEIDAGSALAFRRALTAAPNAKLIVLNSNGGLVQMGLLIADDVFQRKMATLIPAGSKCFSACSFIFLAGSERRADGQLGVHQISSDVPDLQSAQMSISDIIDVLNRFGTPADVLTIMFRTPANDMYVFSSDEVAKYHINRSASDPIPAAPEAAAANPVTTAPGPSNAPTATTQEPGPAASPSPSDALASLNPNAASQLSVLEDYARRPTRLAMFTGLDFAGEDVGIEAVADAGACAQSCLAKGSQCKAFTFNIQTAPGQGPNCFLKASRGQADGNSAAVSGEFLTRSDPNPSAFSIGAIDPTTALHKNVDLVGADLSRRPHPKAKGARECRLACVANSSCLAFTFVAAKKECWLKSGIGQPRAAAGMVSGTKTYQTVSPATIIDLR